MSDQDGNGPLAPLNPWCKDPDVTDIMVDGYNKLYVERRSLGCKFEDVPSTFRDNDHLMDIIDSLVASQGDKRDESSPLIDTHLPDGSHINAVMPPFSQAGPAITTHKTPRDQLTMADLIRFGFWTEEIVEFLCACVHSRLNIVVSGDVASGKTTVLNLIAGMIPTDERIVIIEPMAEVQLPKTHKYVVGLESHPPDIDGKGEVSTQHLVRNALRMRADRIIICNVLGSEAWDLFEAMNTGHDGTLMSIHAESAHDALTRLEMMVTSAHPSLPLQNVRRQMASAIDLITFQERLRDGSRKILKVAEVRGMKGDVIELQDIFEFQQPDIKEHAGRNNPTTSGHFITTGHIPEFLERIETAGVKLSRDLFTPK